MAGETRKGKGLSAEQARQILTKNPKLREGGKDTSWVMERAAQAVKPAAGEEGPDAAFLSLDAEAAIVRAEARFEDGNKKLDEQIAALEERKRALVKELSADVYAWLKKNDPQLTAPATRDALTKHGAFVRKLGFKL